MREDDTDAAEERRRRARAEIMEKARIMEEKRRKKHKAKAADSPTASFDTLVDGDGMLKQNNTGDGADATTSAVEQLPPTEGLTNRRATSPPAKAMHESVDAPIALRQLSSTRDTHPEDPFETDYERELRNTWNLSLPHPAPPASSAHESESLIELTPTSEFPDPDIVLPSSIASHGDSLDQTQYFSIASNSSHTLSEAAPVSPPVVLQFAPNSQSQPQAIPPPSISSMADSIDHVGGSDVEGGSVSDDGVLSEFGDGIRTPASGWTDVGSVLSSDAGH